MIHAFCFYGSKSSQERKQSKQIKLIEEYHVKISFSILSKNMNSIKNYIINFTSRKLIILWMKPQDLRIKQKLVAHIRTRRKNLIQDLIMLIIKTTELDVAFITLLDMKFLIIIVNDAVVKQEDFAYQSVNVQKLVKSEN